MSGTGCGKYEQTFRSSYVSQEKCFCGYHQNQLPTWIMLQVDFNNTWPFNLEMLYGRMFTSSGFGIWLPINLHVQSWASVLIFPASISFKWLYQWFIQVLWGLSELMHFNGIGPVKVVCGSVYMICLLKKET